MLFTEATIWSFACYITLDFAIFYALFAAIPYVFVTQYGFRLGAQGLAFLGLAVGNICAFLLIVVLIKVRQKKIVQAIKAGKAVNRPPEQRLVIALIGSISVPIGLFCSDGQNGTVYTGLCP
jgi:ABC-type Fe3+-siderophore transport system permease subunit